MTIRKIKSLALGITISVVGSTAFAATVVPDGLGAYGDARVDANAGDLSNSATATDFSNRTTSVSGAASGTFEFQEQVGGTLIDRSIQNTASFRADLATGTLGITGGGNAPESRGFSQARIDERLTFDLRAFDPGSRVDVTFTAFVEGSLQPRDNGAFLAESTVDFTLIGGSLNSCDFGFPTCPVSRDDQQFFLNASYTSIADDFDNPPWSVDLQGTDSLWDTVSPTNYAATLSLFGGGFQTVDFLAALSGQGQFAFGNTAYLGISAPAPFSSVSGTFLSNPSTPLTPVPLPAGGALLLTGLVGVAALKRQQRKHT